MWLCDGTFRTSVKPFFQLYVIFAYVEEWKTVFPASFCLLPDKRKLTYMAMFKALRALLQLSKNPTSIMVDFEKSPIAAIRCHFPGTDISGCSYHWESALFSNLEKKNIMEDYKGNAKFQVGYELILTLNWIPTEFVVRAWTDVVKVYFNEEVLKPHRDEDIVSYLKYIESTWIGTHGEGGVFKKPMYAVERWNCVDNIMGGHMTTNNAAENWNGSWNRSCGTTKSLWYLIRNFQSEDARQRTRWNEFLKGTNEGTSKGRMRTEMKYKQIRVAIRNFNKIMADKEYSAEKLKEFVYALKKHV
eukprot:TRINITY_DN9800_c0_g2_i1.p1 TRINITY_DN9800_c0_g2~~TRINITY_DN9800_c0_g2_i1.p1  ORF type:complete len:332 (-),score=41.01 TRINITY_DN9800_c0_g2_i1:109-1014(-)